ncbi:MAG: hypothetical protein ABJF10_23810 [Chthoniobacter sp.]|uniref:hypothetical protein n=1 Tax=Chthoniobacter sp. TaxID=2510640 RepID=UPI0032A398B2
MNLWLSIAELAGAAIGAFFAPNFFKGVIDFNERLGTALFPYSVWAAWFRRASFAARYIGAPSAIVVALFDRRWFDALVVIVAFLILAYRFRVVAGRFSTAHAPNKSPIA